MDSMWRSPARAGWLLAVFILTATSCASSFHRPPPEEGIPRERPSEVERPSDRRESENARIDSRKAPESDSERLSILAKGSPDLTRAAAAAPLALPRAHRPSQRAARSCVRRFGTAPQEPPAGETKPPQEEAPRAVTPPPADAPPHFEEFGNRWSIEPPPYEINSKKSPLNPYELNQLKGDYPVIGQDTFLAIEASNFTILEGRNLPLPSGITGPTPNNEDFFGDGDNFFLTSTTSLTIELFKGQQAFKPVDWRLRMTVAANVTEINLDELGLVNINVDDGPDRFTGDVALEEAFAEIHILDLNDRYDFISSEIGIFSFRSDFRGHIFDERNLGIRIFGNADDNKWQYNVAFFNLLEKDTNSELNRLDGRNQEVFVANVYRFDFPIKGWNQQLSFHFSHDDESVYFDRNDFLRRPTPVGLAAPHEVETYYLGWTSEGHFGRVNISSAVYQVWGNDDNNPFAARDVDISAQLAALEISHDWDWFRLKGYFFYGSGDNDTRDSNAEGFDGIVENPNFAGGEFSYWQRQGLPLLGTFLNNRGSLFANLKSLKFEGQSNFVNPGILIIGSAMDFEVTPTVRAILGANYLRFMETEPLETFLELENIDRDIGAEVYAGVTYRPLLTNNIVLTAGGSVLRPGEALQKIYETDELFWHVFAEIRLTW